MGIRSILRRFRPAGLALLLGLWVMGPLSGILHDTLHHFHGTGEAAAAIIEVPGSELVICHHHPEGCPKDCYCPKITSDRQSTGDHKHPSPSMKEPSLVKCTEGPGHGLPPALIAFWPSSPSALPDLDGAGESASASVPALPDDPFRDPPHKIPRS